MRLSPVDALWTCLAFCFLAAFCLHKLSSYLPVKYKTCRLSVLFQDLIRYGKTKESYKRGTWLCLFDVPKRWFWHFYAVSVTWNTLLLVFHLNLKFQGQSYPSWLIRLLDLLTSIPSPSKEVPQLSTLLLLPLICIHSLRRLQECLCVSVFSDTGAIHLVQYVFGLSYYVLLGLTALCSDRQRQGNGPLLSQLDWFHIAGSTLFIGASLLQHQCIVLLARLRIGKSGAVETLAHQMPVGGWFELVSCPHYFAELLIYVSFSLLLGGQSLTWWLVALYVLTNQALAAQLCHELYVIKYRPYPKHRKAFIPFVL